MKKYIFIALLFSLTLVLNAQNFAFSHYLSIKGAYHFNFPLQRISISMPSLMGFKFVNTPNHTSFMDLNDDANFFLPTDDFVSTEVVRFSAKSKNSTYMNVYLSSVDNFFSNTYLENERSKHSDFELIPAIKNELGKSTSYRCSINGLKTNFYVFFLDGILYKFAIPTTFSDKSVYESAIKSIHKKDFKKEIIGYEKRLKQTYLDKEEEKVDLEKNANEPDLTVLNGITEKPYTFSFEQDGVNIDLPQNYVYHINARKLIEKDDHTIDVYRTDRDRKVPLFFSQFWGPKGTFFYGAKLKEKEDKSAETFGDVFESIYNNTKRFDIVIDGIKGKAIYYGSPSLGSIDCLIEKNDIYYNFSFYNITKENIRYFDEIISGIQIKGDSKRVKYNNEKPLSSVLQLKDLPKVEVNNLRYDKGFVSDMGVFSCNFKKMGMTLFLPGRANQYTYGLNTNWGKDILTLNEEHESPLAPSYNHSFLVIKSTTEQYSVDLTFYLNYGIPFSAEKAIVETVASQGQVKNNKPYSTIGILVAKDGSEWVVLIDESKSNATIKGGNEDYNIEYTIKAEDPERLEYILALTNMFKI